MYCLLQAAFCELVGSAAGYGYFKLLIADVSGLQPGDHILSVEAGALAAYFALCDYPVPCYAGCSALCAGWRLCGGWE
jgi:hypothetical protein